MFDYIAHDFLRAALVFLRISGILLCLPIFGDNSTPVRIRILFSVALTLGLFPIVPIAWGQNIPTDVIGVGVMIVREMIIGFIIGFIAKTAFEGLVMASNIVGFQMGFGTANMLMPDVDPNSTSFTALHKTIVTLIFLGLSLHHIFIQAIADSFLMIPAGAASINGSLGEIMIKVSAGLFIIAIQLAAPILVALLFTMAALGLLARAVPQVNVFVMSFPASFFVGLLIYIATLPFFPGWLRDDFQLEQMQIFAAMRGMAHP